MIKEIKQRRIELAFEKLFTQNKHINILADGSVYSIQSNPRWLTFSREFYFTVLQKNILRFLEDNNTDIPIEFIINKLNTKNLKVVFCD